MTEAGAARSHARVEFAAATALTLGIVSLFRLRPVPFSNELIYLLIPYHGAHPEFLPGDWTFSGGHSDHALFDLLVSLPMRIMSLETVGWIGRVVCWILLTAGLLRLVQRLGIRPMVGAVLIALWGMAGALYGGEGFFFGFEAKEAAYVLLFWGLERIVAGRKDIGALLLGLTFLLHAAVGASVILAAAVAFAVAGDRRELGRRAGALAVGGVLGFIAIAPVLRGEAVPPDMWKVMTISVLPTHFNPTSWGIAPVILSAGMLLFNILSYRARPREWSLKFLLAFQCTLAAATVIGLIAFDVGAYGLLRIYPFRVFPFVVPLFFFISLVRAYQLGLLTPANRLLSLCALAVVWNYGHGFKTMDWEIRRSFTSWREPADNLDKAMMWVRANTDPTATLITPPWRNTAFYLTGRSQVANFHAVASDRLAEWRQRNESLIGPLGPMRTLDWDRMQLFYNSLSVEALGDVRRRYGGDYLVSAASYPFPKVHAEGNYSVYDLRGLSPAAPVPRTR